MKKTYLIILFCLTAILALHSAGRTAGFDRDSVMRSAFDVYPPVLSESGVPNSDIEQSQGLPQAFSIQNLTDIVLSPSEAPARFDQDNPALMLYPDGRFLAVWDDDRQGSRKIFWQWLTAEGIADGANELRAGSSIGANIVEPLPATDDQNRVYLFYRDRTNGILYASRYLADGTEDLAPFAVNQSPINSFAGPFDVALYPDGRAVVVWQSSSVLGSTIEGRIISASGSFEDDQFTINTDGGGTPHWVPSVAIEPTSGFLVAWEDYRNGNADVYARLFDGLGSPLGSDFALVPSPPSDADQFTPEVAFLTTDIYAVAWIDTRDGQGVFIQAYNTNSGLSGANRRLSEGGALDLCWDVSLGLAQGSYLLAAWASFAAENSISTRRLDFNLDPLEAPFALVSSAVGQRWAPAVQAHGDTTIAVLYRELLDNQADIKLGLFDTLGAARIQPPVKVNGDAIGAPSLRPAIAHSGDRHATYVWVDKRRDAGDILIRAINTVLEPARGAWTVNQDIGSAVQSEPDIAAALNQEALVVWVDNRVVGGVSGQRIYGRYADVIGRLTTDEFVISDSGQGEAKNSVKAATNTSLLSLVTWIDYREGLARVYARWLASNHALDGDEFVITPSATARNGSLRLDVTPEGEFCSAWLDTLNGSVVGRVSWFNTDKSAGPSYTFAPQSADTVIDSMSLAVYSGRQAAILWTATVTGERHLFLSYLDDTGALLQPTVSVTDDPSAAPRGPAVDFDELGNLSAAWTDFRLGHAAVYYQLYNDSRAPIGTNAAAFSQTAEFATSAVTEVGRGHAWFGWVDPRQNGLNVYGSVSFFLPTDNPDQPPDGLPTQFRLDQNYPNPFNPSTEIAFALPMTADVQLTIYNVLGRRVKTLVSGRLAAGEHRISWDGSDDNGDLTASGVYLYRLTTDSFSEVRKMMLVK